MNAPHKSITPAERVVAPDKLVQLVRPFVGTQREIHRGDGSRLDVRHIMNSVDMDLRAVDASGLRYQWDGFGHTVPWATVQSVTITDRLGTVTYFNAAYRGLLTDAELRFVAKGGERFKRECGR